MVFIFRASVDMISEEDDDESLLFLYLLFKFLASAPILLELGMVDLDSKSDTFEVLALKEMEEEAD